MGLIKHKYIELLLSYGTYDSVINWVSSVLVCRKLRDLYKMYWILWHIFSVLLNFSLHHFSIDLTENNNLKLIYEYNSMLCIQIRKNILSSLIHWRINAMIYPWPLSNTGIRGAELSTPLSRCAVEHLHETFDFPKT